MEKDPLLFANRASFRKWLGHNHGVSAGVWLVFGKTGGPTTLTAAEALEEALCFGWIDGLMKSLDKTKYIKYFAPRRKKSVWSEKNKAAVAVLRERRLMTEAGEAAVAQAVANGNWDAPKRQPITDEQIALLAGKLRGSEPAYANFMNMSGSVRKTYTGAYFSGKTDQTRAKTLLRITDRLNKNLKPM